MDLLNLATSRRFAEKLVNQLGNTAAVPVMPEGGILPLFGDPTKIYVIPFTDGRGRKCHNNFLWLNDFWLLINTTVEGGELDLYVN